MDVPDLRNKEDPSRQNNLVFLPSRQRDTVSEVVSFRLERCGMGCKHSIPGILE